MMKSLIRTAVAVVLIGVALTWVASAILGSDWKPFKKAAVTDMRERILSLVSEKNLALERVEEQMASIRDLVQKAVAHRARAQAENRRLEARLASERGQLEADRFSLNVLERRRNEGIPVSTRSGIRLDGDQIALRIEKVRLAVSLGDEKVRVLSAMVERSRNYVAALDRRIDEAPTRLAQLEISRDHLRAKVGFYDEIAKLVGEHERFGTFEGRFAEAERVLNEAHASLDADLASAMSLFEVSAWSEPLDLTSGLNTEVLDAELSVRERR